MSNRPDLLTPEEVAAIAGRAGERGVSNQTIEEALQTARDLFALLRDRTALLDAARAVSKDADEAIKAFQIGAIQSAQITKELRARAQALSARVAELEGALANSQPAYPKGNVAGPCVCGSWPGGPCLKCEWRPAALSNKDT